MTKEKEVLGEKGRNHQTPKKWKRARKTRRRGGFATKKRALLCKFAGKGKNLERMGGRRR